MSPAQKTLYFRLWRDACRVQGWKSSDRELRLEQHRIAIGTTRSSTSLTQTQIDSVFAQFKLLADPDNIEAHLAIDNPELGQIKRIQFALSKFHEALVSKISADKFGTKNWKSLTCEQSQELLMTCKRSERQSDLRRTRAMQRSTPIVRQAADQDTLETVSHDNNPF